MTTAIHINSVIVAEKHCRSCGAETKEVYHMDVPELRVADTDAERAAARLAEQLEAAAEFAEPPALGEPVRHAVEDVRAFIEENEALHPV